MRKAIASISALALFLGLCACTAAQPEGQGSEEAQAPTWQEQYDLGVRYLSEGNYEEAILAFTAAIEIDPKLAPAYVGRGDAYTVRAQTLADGVTDPAQMDKDAIAAYEKALEDYLQAIDLGETDDALYQKAAETYVSLGDPYSAASLLGSRSFLAHIIAVGGGSIAVVKEDGTLWVWGHGAYGLMDSWGSAPEEPTLVMTGVSSVFGWKSCIINSSGVQEVYTAILKTDGSLWVLGDDPVSSWDNTSGSVPKKIADQVLSASAGENEIAVLKMDGSLWLCDYWDGQNKVMDDVASISSCGSTYAAVKTDGSLWMWGGNRYGQLGIGSTDNRDTPVKVMDDVAFVDMCNTYTAAIKTDGTLWMWGDNSRGQLGTAMAYNEMAVVEGYTYDEQTRQTMTMTGQIPIQTTPVKVMDNVVLVSGDSGGGYAAYAVRTDGTLWCWGDNSRGQLGIEGGGTRALDVPDTAGDGRFMYDSCVIQDVPVKVMDNVITVSGNCGTTAAIKRDGTVWVAGQSVSDYEERFSVFTEVPNLTIRSREMDILSELEGKTFTFASGVGGWGTQLTFGSNGTFHGEYSDWDMGDSDPAYPNGTNYYCSFDGSFTDFQRVDEFTYSMQIESLNFDPPEKTTIEDGARRISSEPYGMEDAGLFYLYLPGKETAGLSERFIEWIGMPRAWSATPLVLPCWCLYNVNAETGFSEF